jgi:hypothetical protein
LFIICTVTTTVCIIFLLPSKNFLTANCWVMAIRQKSDGLIIISLGLGCCINKYYGLDVGFVGGFVFDIYYI